MDELANKVLDRINGLSRKALKENDLSQAETKTYFVRISECVRLIRRIEKIEVEASSDDAEDVWKMKPATPGSKDDPLLAICWRRGAQLKPYKHMTCL